VETFIKSLGLHQDPGHGDLQDLGREDLHQDLGRGHLHQDPGLGNTSSRAQPRRPLKEIKTNNKKRKVEISEEKKGKKYHEWKNSKFKVFTDDLLKILHDDANYSPTQSSWSSWAKKTILRSNRQVHHLNPVTERKKARKENI